MTQGLTPYCDSLLEHYPSQQTTDVALGPALSNSLSLLRSLAILVNPPLSVMQFGVAVETVYIALINFGFKL